MRFWGINPRWGGRGDFTQPILLNDSSSRCWLILSALNWLISVDYLMKRPLSLVCAIIGSEFEQFSKFLSFDFPQISLNFSPLFLMTVWLCWHFLIASLTPYWLFESARTLLFSFSGYSAHFDLTTRDRTSLQLSRLWVKSAIVLSSINLLL